LPTLGSKRTILTGRNRGRDWIRELHRLSWKFQRCPVLRECLSIHTHQDSWTRRVHIRPPMTYSVVMPRRSCKRNRDHLRESDCLRTEVPPRIRNLCCDGPAEAKKRSAYPHKEGHNNRLCAEHAHRAGSHQVRNPCRDCPPEAKKTSIYPDEGGKQQETVCRACPKHGVVQGPESVS